jgi:hypothetical protein
MFFILALVVGLAYFAIACAGESLAEVSKFLPQSA